MLLRALAPLVGLLALLAATAGARAEPPWPPAVQRALASAGLPDDALAVAALPLAHAAAPWGRQMHRAMQPGSAMKVLTSIVALDQIGPNHRGFTELASAAPLDTASGTLQGDLVLRGGADAELGRRSCGRCWSICARPACAPSPATCCWTAPATARRGWMWAYRRSTKRRSSPTT